jgi:hypothetical protein
MAAGLKLAQHGRTAQALFTCFWTGRPSADLTAMRISRLSVQRRQTPSRSRNVQKPRMMKGSKVLFLAHLHVVEAEIAGMDLFQLLPVT